jgi:hypothetical protein
VEFLMFAAGPSSGSGRAGAGGGAGPPRPASINHFCITLYHFTPDEILKTLERYGIKPRESHTGSVGPLRHYISAEIKRPHGRVGFCSLGSDLLERSVDGPQRPF